MIPRTWWRGVMMMMVMKGLVLWGEAFMVKPPHQPATSSNCRQPSAVQPLYNFFQKAIYNNFQLIMDEVRHGTEEGKEEIDRLRDWIEAKVGVQPEDVIHPLFGEIIKDLGYKLTSIPVWEKQRIFRKERAQLIAKDIETKLKANQPLTLPGVITVYEMGDNYGLLDGQHRVGALRILAENGILSPETHLILVEVFPVKEEEQIKRLFTEINTAQPVNIIDLPDMADAGEKEIITRAADLLRLEYGAMFSPSTNCRIPNVNVDNIRDELFKANVVGRLGMTTAEQLLEWIKAKNNVLASKNEKHWQKSFKGRNMETLNKALTKAKTNKFFLGLDRNWMDIVVPGEEEEVLA